MSNENNAMDISLMGLRKTYRELYSNPEWLRKLTGDISINSIKNNSCSTRPYDFLAKFTQKYTTRFSKNLLRDIITGDSEFYEVRLLYSSPLDKQDGSYISNGIKELQKFGIKIKDDDKLNIEKQGYVDHLKVPVDVLEKLDLPIKISWSEEKTRVN